MRFVDAMANQCPLQALTPSRRTHPAEVEKRHLSDQVHARHGRKPVVASDKEESIARDREPHFEIELATINGHRVGRPNLILDGDESRDVRFVSQLFNKSGRALLRSDCSDPKPARPILNSALRKTGRFQRPRQSFAP